MLPTEQRPGPIRRLLEYLELVKPTAGAHPVLEAFGLSDDGARHSRYARQEHGHVDVEPQLDDDVDALRARVAELEARLTALEEAR